MLLLSYRPNQTSNPNALKLAIVAGISSLSLMGTATQAQERVAETGSLVP